MFKKYKYLFIILLVIIATVVGILTSHISRKEDIKMDNTLNITSSAFKNKDYIPSKYTGQGKDISIPLEFNNIDEGKSIAIIMDDPDAPFGTFTHWLIWNIPISTTKIPENISTDNVVSSLGGAIQGKNDFGKIGYKGPNPPSGTHNYKIKVYVLDIFLNLLAGSSKGALEGAINGHVLHTGLLEGKFSK